MEIQPEIDQKFKKSHKCDIYNKELTTNGNLKKHITDVHESTKTFMCNVCDKCFIQKAKLEQHISSIHDDIKSKQYEKETEENIMEKENLHG